MTAEMLREISIPPQSGTEDYQRWVEQSDFLSFLEKNQLEYNDVVLYAGLPPSTFVHSVLVPIQYLSPLNVDDLMKRNNCTPWNSWTHNYNNEPSKTRVFLPLSNCSSKTLLHGEQILFGRTFQGRLEDKEYFEISQKFSHLNDLHYFPEKNHFVDLIMRVTSKK